MRHIRIESLESRVVFAESRNWVFVLVETSDGIRGVGEATLEWQTRAVVGCVDDLRGWIVGRDADDPRALWDEVWRRAYYPPGPVLATALSGIDQALWDAAGKRAGTPVWRLLAAWGTENRHSFPEKLSSLPSSRSLLPAYLNLGAGERPEREYRPDYARAAEEAAQARGSGWRRVKWKPIPPGWCGRDPGVGEVVAAMEGIAGTGLEQAVDLHGRCDAEAACRLVREVSACAWRDRILFVEEPVRPEDREGLGRVHREARVPLATGERLCTRFAFAPLIETGTVDLLQPDVGRIGGITEVVRLAASCEGRHGIGLAPHCAAGPVALAASVHLGFALPSVRLQECFLRDAPWRDEVVAGAPSPDPQAGGFAPPEAPGLGVEFDEERAALHPFREVVPPRPVDGEGRVVPW